MILYHALSSYQLLHCMVHKLTFNKNERCHIIVSDNIKDKYPQYIDLKGFFFDEVFIYTSSDFFKDRVNVVRNTSLVFDHYFKKNKIKLEEYSEIIVGCAHNFFGIYLAENNIPFTFIEDASGLISRPEVLEDIESKFFYNRYEVCKKLGLYDANNRLVQKIICNINTQKDGFADERVEHFDIVERMTQFDEITIGKIIDFFGIPQRFDSSSESTILLTQHFANLKVLSLQQQKDIYNLIVDYFIDDQSKLVIKPHPDDLLYYEIMYPNAKVIRDTFPSELIPFVFSKKPNKVMTINSTAINNLEPFFERSFKFSFGFEKRYEIIHKYIFTLKMIDAINYRGKIYSFNADLQLLKNIAETHYKSRFNIIEIDKLSRVEKGSILIVDDLGSNISESIELSKTIRKSLDSIDTSSIVFFMNSEKNYVFYDYPKKEVFNHILTIELYIQDFQDVLSDNTSEIIYVFTSRGDVSKLINDFSYSIDLAHSNKKVTFIKHTEEQRRIRVLEGMLEATEKRLEHYIQLEAELRQKLQSNK